MSESRPPADREDFQSIVQARLSRRSLIKAATAALVAALSRPWQAVRAQQTQAPTTGPPPHFQQIAYGIDQTHHVAPGYQVQVLIRWGDPVLSGAPPFDPYRQTAAAQAMQFGYNNDYVAFFPLSGADHGLVCVNHEYTNEELMFPGMRPQGKHNQHPDMTRELVEIEMAAQGGSVLEVRRTDGQWRVVKDSPWARRITPLHTGIQITGPAAGDPRLRTKADPTGTQVIGTIGNCAGGVTPWGTYLMAEENFDDYFYGELNQKHPEYRNYRRYRVPGRAYAWGRYFARWDINQEPNEANRFGWIVELDPSRPSSTPIKRTALGRFKHEGAECIVNRDGRVVVYMGDDEAFEYLYRFVSEHPLQAQHPIANRALLDSGTLSVARFEADGTLIWLPLVFGQDGLNAGNGFHSQADVLIEARHAAEFRGATPMDRPEGVAADPGRVYVCLSNNIKRLPWQVDAANPRAFNLWGQIVELTPPEEDHAASAFTWEILIKCGNQASALAGAKWRNKDQPHDSFNSPDNIVIDHSGNLWATTDQAIQLSRTTGNANGLWRLQREGAARGTAKMFFRAPFGAEPCGPGFTPDDRTLFLSIQHPGAYGNKAIAHLGRASTFNDPATRWPDFDDGYPPRPSVVVITKTGGGKIGS